MMNENEFEFNFEKWFMNLEMSISRELTKEEWNEYADFQIEDFYTEREFLIGYYDMGMFDEIIVRASSKELAIDSFLDDYKPKRGLSPYVVRCETIELAKERIELGGADSPDDGQFWRY